MIPDHLFQLLEGPTVGTVTQSQVLVSLLLAFVLGQLIAWVYYATHNGLSYSRSFVQSLVLITVVVAMVMFTIGNSLVTAMGLMGALAIIRFRNMVKDTRDIAFIFMALVIGMATGTQRFAIAVVGTLVLAAIILYLQWSDFGAHQPHNGFLRFQACGTIDPDHPLPAILKRFCNKSTLISVQRNTGNGYAEYAYHVLVTDAFDNERFVADLERVAGLEDVSLTMQEQLLEV